MKLKVLKRKTTELKDFTNREWKNADQEHYGMVIDFTPTEYTVVAREGTTILGKVSIRIIAGVGEVREMIVAQSAQGKGTGTRLMIKLEELARKHNAHKLWLYTGRGWKAEQLYLKLGYVKSGELLKHHVKKDFAIYTKFL
jgi:GNAT superfamily N-acetyltransferase